MGWGATACPQTTTVSDNFNHLNAENSATPSSASSLTTSSLTSSWYVQQQQQQPIKPSTTPSSSSSYYNETHSALNLQQQHQHHNIDKTLSQFPSPSIPPPSHQEKKSYTPCRYQQDKIDFFSGFGANILPSETVSRAAAVAAAAAAASAYPSQSPYSVQSLHDSTLNQVNHYATGNYHMQGGPPNPIHDSSGRSCALPSPTIYPPTPPPSAPWIHPWFVGDTF